MISLKVNSMSISKKEKSFKIIIIQRYQIWKNKSRNIKYIFKTMKHL